MLQVGFTKGHGESIWPGVDKNFTKIMEFFDLSGINCVSIEGEIGNNELEKYATIIVGAPTMNFTESELSIIRQYVKQGGNLFVLFMFGGDHILKTNIGTLFPEVSPNNDEVFDPTRKPRRIDKYHPFKPIIPVFANKADLYFNGDILYDSGCTFDVEGDGEIEITPQNCMSIENPIDGYCMNLSKMESGTPAGPIFVRKKIGNGTINYWGARWSFSDEMWDMCDNASFMRTLLPILIGNEMIDEELDRRMSLPQRHRLLHGYPMSSAMRSLRIRGYRDLLRSMSSSRGKPLAVGIIPHPLCTTSEERCGYCPFPCEEYNILQEKKSIDTVIAELGQLDEEFPEITRRRISSLYFGGGTANLTSKDHFRKLCNHLQDVLRIDHQTEITLEGAPKFFENNAILLGVMKEYFPRSKLRISIGVQTFNKHFLERAGRSSLNAEGTVENSIEIARNHGFIVSCDMLFNLPGPQTFSEIQADIDRIVGLGIDHICWYHLVAFDGLNTPWSKDQQILNSLPSQEQALKNWEQLYDQMIDHGYRSVTVTDFKRKGSGGSGRYVYEEDLRTPEDTDWLGIGPYAISVFTDKRLQSGIKLMNPDGLNEYAKRQKREGLTWERYYKYDETDVKLYWVTRQIKGTAISKDKYKSLFEEDIEFTFGKELNALVKHGLLQNTEDTYVLTRNGFFYADSVAGLLSWLRVSEVKTRWMPGKVVLKKQGQMIELRSKKEIREFWNSAKHEWMG